MGDDDSQVAGNATKKSIGVPLASYASRCMLGETLEQIGFTEEVHMPCEP